jgi:hypothetical protein
MPRWSTPVQVARQTSQLGLLLEASADFGFALDADGSRPLRGLFVNLSPKNTNNVDQCTATLRIGVGRTGGGARASRTWTLLPGGAWWSAAGWASVSLEVLDIPDDVVVSYAWLTQQPPSFWPLQLVESVTAGTRPVPDGAIGVGVGTADAGWTWRARPGTAAAVVLAAPQLADGVRRPVMGSAYTASVDNTVSWELAPL